MPYMLNPLPFYRKPDFWRRAIPIFLLATWVAAFWREFWMVYQWLRYFYLTGDILWNPQIRLTLFVLAINVLAFVFYIYSGLWVVSQFVLPVHSAKDRAKVFDRLKLYFYHRHGPAVFIKEGEEIANPEELRSSRSGVAFVDLSSAIVLERQPFVVTVSGKVRARRKYIFFGPKKTSSEEVPKVTVRPLARAAGPGIVFTERGEKIKGVVSLRRQVRVQPNVRSTTRDGFEVQATIVTVFSLGDSPDVLRVGYIGTGAEDLRVIQLEDRFVEGQKVQVIKGFTDELDLEDKQEIHRFVQSYTPLVVFPVSPPEEEQGVTSAPYTFDPERIFQAVYADTHLTRVYADPARPTEEFVEGWQELPVKIAVETFHNMVSRWKYADLYKPKDEKEFPLNTRFKPEFSRRVRNQGVLSYQFFRRRDGRLFEKEQEWNEPDLEAFPVQMLHTSKVLRDRGIRVIAATFPELRPGNPAVRQQLLEYWRASWQRDASLARAEYDYREIKLRAEARANSQKEIAKALSEILNDTSVTQEVIAVRVLQAVENFARYPATGRLLPNETLGMLSTLQQWLSEDKQLQGGDEEIVEGEYTDDTSLPGGS